MSLLSSITTELGRIELHHEGGRFFNRRVYRTEKLDTLFGPRDEIVPVQIPLSREQALGWHELAHKKGRVHADFPEREEVGDRA